MGWHRFSAISPLLFNRQCRFVRSFVFFCRDLSMCDIHPVTTNTAMLMSGTKVTSDLQKYLVLISNIPHCQSSCSEALENYPNGTKERVKKLNQRDSRPIHGKLFCSAVVLCLSGDTWLAVAKGLTYSVTTQHWDLLHPMPPLIPCNVCSGTHAIPCSAWLHPLIELLLLF